MSGPGILLFLLLVMTLVLGEALARVLPRRGLVLTGRPIRLAMLGATLLYAGALVIVSGRSAQRLVARGETLQFCGFYLDCHLGIAVAAVDRVPSIGTRQAQGTFHVVTIRLSSNARRATLHSAEPGLVVIDEAGRRFARDREAERALGGNPPDNREFSLAPGAHQDMTVVFDLPGKTEDPRLEVTSARGVERLLEAVLIGDDDSLLHPRPLLVLR